MKVIKQLFAKPANITTNLVPEPIFSAIMIISLTMMFSCTLETRLRRTQPTAGVSQPPKAATVRKADSPPPLRIEYRGDSLYLTEAEIVGTDTIASIKAATVNVVSEVRNVAERNGQLLLSFRVTIPKKMLGTSREILLHPTLHIPTQNFKKDSMVFDPLCLRGRTMDILQSREYWQLWRHQKLFPRDTLARQRYILFPYTDNARLDSVTIGRHEAVFLYTESVSSENMPRRLNLTVPGQILSIDGTCYRVPARDTVGYVISSMTEFLDTATRHRIKIVDRNISVEEKSRITFLTGKHFLSDSVGRNREEFEAIQDLQRKVRELPDLELDSILITATASPEGSYRNNTRLSELRGKSVADSLFDGFNPIIRTMAENWEDLVDSIKRMNLTRKNEILSLISSTEDPDEREASIRTRFPEEYAQIRKAVYPSLRLVSVRYCMHRKGMIKDTIHLREIDTTYMDALQQLKQRRYTKALAVLSEYKDRNAAIAMMSLGYDRQALEIISKEPESDIREYLLAILSSRLGMTEKAREHYLQACRLNSMMEFRGNLDPEINRILNQ